MEDDLRPLKPRRGRRKVRPWRGQQLERWERIGKLMAEEPALEYEIVPSKNGGRSTIVFKDGPLSPATMTLERELRGQSRLIAMLEVPRAQSELLLLEGAAYAAAGDADLGDITHFLELIRDYGIWALTRFPMLAHAAARLQAHAVAGDPPSKEAWKALCLALSALPAGRPAVTVSPREVVEVYERELTWCREYRRIEKAAFRHARGDSGLMRQADEMLFKKFGARNVALAPTEWAYRRTADELRLAPEKVRRTVLDAKRVRI